MAPDSELTIVIATYGAILSTAALLWNVVRDVTNKGKLRVACYLGEIWNAGGHKDPGTYLVWNVTNVGRLPVLLTHVGGKKDGKTDFMIPPHQQFPVMLRPGEFVIEYTDELSVLRENPQALWAIDSIGHCYRVPRRQLRKILKDLRAKSHA